MTSPICEMFADETAKRKVFPERILTASHGSVYIYESGETHFFPPGKGPATGKIYRGINLPPSSRTAVGGNYTYVVRRKERWRTTLEDAVQDSQRYKYGSVIEYKGNASVLQPGRYRTTVVALTFSPQSSRGHTRRS